MDVNLDKEGLKALVAGTTPNYNVMDNPLVSRNGHYVGGFHNKWNWSINDDNTEEELWELYNLCKNSWK